MKFVHTCAHCGTTIRSTASDPVVSAPSLGKGFYHFACAQRVWAAQRGEELNYDPPEPDEIDEVADIAMALLEAQ